MAYFRKKSYTVNFDDKVFFSSISEELHASMYNEFKENKFLHLECTPIFVSIVNKTFKIDVISFRFTVSSNEINLHPV